MLHDIDFLGVGLMSGIDNKIESFFEIDYKFSLLKFGRNFWYALGDTHYGQKYA